MKILSDIRFWIALFFFLRLYGINNPPLERAVTWRQCDGLMIARNFYEGNANILFPTVDMAGDKTGIVGSEFPIYNYSIYLVARIFGFHNWIGRLINLLISSIGIWFFFLSLKKYFGERSAFYSTLILLTSMWFAYSRIVIPDIFGASLCLISIYYAMLYLEKGSIKHYLIFFLLALIASLAKISAASLLTVLAIPVLSKRILLTRKIYFSGAALIILGLVCLWYFYWVPYLNVTYEFDGHFFMGQTISDGLSQILNHLPLTLERFYYTPLKYTGFAFFLFSIYFSVYKKNYLALLVFIIPFLVFMYFVLISGWGFYTNSYYPIMFVPPMAVLMGVVLSCIRERISFVIVLILITEGILNQIHMFSIREFMMPYACLENVLDESGVKKNDLIAINSGSQHDPTPFYFAHRKGWGLSNSDLTNEEVLKELKVHRCRYILVLTIDSIEGTELSLKKIYDSKNFVVYEL